MARTHFAFRIDMWSDDGEKVVKHLAGAEGLPGGEGNVSGRLQTLAQRGHHLASGHAGN